MKDAKLSALEVLRRRGQEDAARALAGVQVDLRHVGDPPGRPGGRRVQADVLIKGPHELVSCVRNKRYPQAGWGQEIENALREASGEEYDIRNVQWYEEGSTSDAWRPGTAGMGPSGGNAPA